MTTVATPAQRRPRLRPDVVLGPPVRQSGQEVHYVKDAATGRFFQIGPREFFLLSRMDGHATLAEIGDEYTAAYGRRLTSGSWEQLLGLLVTRRLLSGTAGDGELSALAEWADADRRAISRPAGWWRHRFPLFNPDRLLGRVAPKLGFAFTAWFVVPALATVGVLEVFLVTRLGPLLEEAVRVWEWPALGVAVVAWIWLGVAAHELAHGLTCKHHGGTAREIGVIWRFPLLLAPYCKVDDVVLFRRRRQRVYTAFAGVFTNLLLLLPAAPLWLLAPPGSAVRHVAAAMLLFGSVVALLNLVPFYHLDGYFMLSHALGMQNLSEESRRFLTGKLRRRPASYSRRDAMIYTAYGIGSAVAFLALLGWGVAVVATLLRSWVAG